MPVPGTEIPRHVELMLDEYGQPLYLIQYPVDRIVGLIGVELLLPILEVPVHPVIMCQSSQN